MDQLWQNGSARLPAGAEVIDRVIRLGSAEPEELALDLQEAGLADPIPLDAAPAAAAGRLRARRYHRTHCAVSLADCVVAVTAAALNVAVATADPHLRDVCHAEWIAVVPLPGTDSSIWAARDGAD